ncbi:MAG: hypothetical protein P4N59_23470 [Negativicutes bacterium]|nr:hypothetical protein [Negativicutes bacterium]
MAYDNAYAFVATEADIIGCFRLLLGRAPEKKVARASATSRSLSLGEPVAQVGYWRLQPYSYNIKMWHSNIERDKRPIIISEISHSFLKCISGASLDDYLRALLANETYRMSVIKSPEEIVECERDIEKVLGLYAAHVAECMDVVVYPLEKKHQVHG